VQLTKKPSLTPDLDGQRTSYSKTGKKKSHIYNDCSQATNPLGNPGEPSSLTYLMKIQPNYPVLIAIAEKGEKQKEVKLR